MQSGFRYLQNKMVREQLVELLDEKFPPIGVELSHPLDMTQEISVGDETGERCLIDRG